MWGCCLAPPPWCGLTHGGARCVPLRSERCPRPTGRTSGRAWCRRSCNRLDHAPLTAGHLVGDLDAVAVGVPDVDPDGMAVVRHMVDRYVLLFNAEVQLLQVVEALHIPCHVVEPHLPFLGSWSILAHFDQ